MTHPGRSTALSMRLQNTQLEGPPAVDLTTVLAGFVADLSVEFDRVLVFRDDAFPVLDMFLQLEHWLAGGPGSEFEYESIEGPMEPPIRIRRHDERVEVGFGAYPAFEVPTGELMDAVIRLRHEIEPEFARLIGVSLEAWRRKHDPTIQ